MATMRTPDVILSFLAQLGVLADLPGSAETLRKAAGSGGKGSRGDSSSSGSTRPHKYLRRVRKVVGGLLRWAYTYAIPKGREPKPHDPADAPAEERMEHRRGLLRGALRSFVDLARATLDHLAAKAAREPVEGGEEATSRAPRAPREPKEPGDESATPRERPPVWTLAQLEDRRRHLMAALDFMERHDATHSAEWHKAQAELHALGEQLAAAAKQHGHALPDEPAEHDPEGDAKRAGEREAKRLEEKKAKELPPPPDPRLAAWQSRAAAAKAATDAHAAPAPDDALAHATHAAAHRAEAGTLRGVLDEMQAAGHGEHEAAGGIKARLAEVDGKAKEHEGQAEALRKPAGVAPPEKKEPEPPAREAPAAPEAPAPPVAAAPSPPRDSAPEPERGTTPTSAAKQWKIGSKATKAWVARITGEHPRYGMDRKFVDSTTSYQGARVWDMRTPGLYEVRGDDAGGFRMVWTKEDGSLGWTDVPRERAQQIAKYLHNGMPFDEARRMTHPDPAKRPAAPSPAGKVAQAAAEARDVAEAARDAHHKAQAAVVDAAVKEAQQVAGAAAPSPPPAADPDRQRALAAVEKLREATGTKGEAAPPAAETVAAPVAEPAKKPGQWAGYVSDAAGHIERFADRQARHIEGARARGEHPEDIRQMETRVANARYAAKVLREHSAQGLAKDRDSAKSALIMHLGTADLDVLRASDAAAEARSAAAAAAAKAKPAPGRASAPPKPKRVKAAPFAVGYIADTLRELVDQDFAESEEEKATVAEITGAFAKDHLTLPADPETAEKWAAYLSGHAESEEESGRDGDPFARHAAKGLYGVVSALHEHARDLRNRGAADRVAEALRNPPTDPGERADLLAVVENRLRASKPGEERARLIEAYHALRKQSEPQAKALPSPWRPSVASSAASSSVSSSTAAARLRAAL